LSPKQPISFQQLERKRDSVTVKGYQTVWLHNVTLEIIILKKLNSYLDINVFEKLQQQLMP